MAFSRRRPNGYLSKGATAPPWLWAKYVIQEEVTDRAKSGSFSTTERPKIQKQEHEGERYQHGLGHQTKAQQEEDHAIAERDWAPDIK
jgi:hypothetical protein